MPRQWTSCRSSLPNSAATFAQVAAVSAVNGGNGRGKCDAFTVSALRCLRGDQKLHGYSLEGIWKSGIHSIQRNSQAPMEKLRSIGLRSA